jgi:GT2 family glycosyltransferase
MGSWLDPLKRRAILWNRRRLHQRMQSRMPRYGDWCARFDTLDAATRAALQERLQQLEALPGRPLPTLLLPAQGGTPAGHLRFFAALQAQIDPQWRLLVGHAPGDDPAVLEGWRARAATDSRVALVDAPAPGLACRRALLAAAPTAWLAFTDLSDVWREHALLLLAEAAARFSGARLIYADEDRTNANGQRSDPQFKCDWNPELLLGHDCIGRPALWSADALRARIATAWADARPDSPAAGPGWRHDMALLGTEGLAASEVVHLPHLLCHRLGEGAAGSGASPGAVQAHLDRTGVHARAEAQAGIDGVRVRFAVPQPAPLVSMVIPTRNGLDLLRPCVDSILRRSTYPAFEIIIVDNGSDDPACLAWMQQAAKDPRISIRRDDRPFNFSALNNAAVADARGEFIALVNNDIEVITPGWLEEMVSLAARPGIGAVGARLWYGDGTLQHGGVITGIGASAGHAHKKLTRGEPGMMGRAQRLQALSAVTAACLVVRREAYEQVGGLDEEAFVVAFNDIDFCLKLRAAGLRNVWTPFAELYHHESVSRGSDRHPSRKQRFERERAALQARWGAALARDPAYNPNLTLNNENFALADPPRVSLHRPWFEPGASE